MTTMTPTRKAISALISALAILATFTATADPAHAVTNKTVKVKFTPSNNYTTAEVKIKPVKGANTYLVWSSLGGNPVFAERRCGIFWTRCNWYAQVAMPKDQAAKITVSALAKRKDKSMKRIGITSKLLFNPTDIAVGLNIAAAKGLYKLGETEPPKYTTEAARKSIRSYYKCVRWSPVAVTALIVAQAALHDPEDIKGTYDIITGEDLDNDKVRKFLGTKSTPGNCDPHITPIVGAGIEHLDG